MSTWDGAKEKAGKTAEDVKQNNSADANTDLGVTWDSVRNRYADSSNALDPKPTASATSVGHEYEASKTNTDQVVDYAK